MTVTRAEIRALIAAECGEATRKADEFDALRKLFDDERRRSDELAGQLEAFRDIDAARIALVASHAKLEARRESDRWFVYGSVVAGFFGAAAITVGAFQVADDVELGSAFIGGGLILTAGAVIVPLLRW